MHVKRRVGRSARQEQTDAMKTNDLRAGASYFGGTAQPSFILEGRGIQEQGRQGEEKSEKRSRTTLRGNGRRKVIEQMTSGPVDLDSGVKPSFDSSVSISGEEVPDTWLAFGHLGDPCLDLAQ